MSVRFDSRVISAEEAARLNAPPAAGLNAPIILSLRVIPRVTFLRLAMPPLVLRKRTPSHLPQFLLCVRSAMSASPSAHRYGMWLMSFSTGPTLLRISRLPSPTFLRTGY